MKIPTIVWILIGGAVAYYLYQQANATAAQTNLTDTAEQDAATASLQAYQNDLATQSAQSQQYDSGTALTVPLASAGVNAIASLANLFSSNN